MDLIICFIDDSDFEHDLMKKEIAPHAPGLTFVQAYTFEEAQERLGGKIPILFLLDLWGQDPDIAGPSITPREELEAMVSGFMTLDDVCEGLESHEADRNNEYLKRLFTLVDAWRTLFERVCDRIGQNRKYGLANLGHVRGHYPGVSAVFYTRKSMINDAVAMIRSGADGLFIKPTGPDDNETRRLTRGYAPALITDLIRIVDVHIENLMSHQAFYKDKGREKGTDVEDLISSWKEFTNK
jgi:DNA-binding NarL/FixJ family response regulator